MSLDWAKGKESDLFISLPSDVGRAGTSSHIVKKGIGLSRKIEKKSIAKYNLEQKILIYNTSIKRLW